ncbi:hypothetical protein KGN15_000810 [Lactococcus lactis]|uniref:hypothetical protein n=1 Tax=Lactococcus lactis TaxID=1358 RepID=UPI001C1F8381|nr:hypothetical protein [Lactococcus lactis]MBU7532860.1 hypothetical protein [Lactococcus lactis]
MKQYWVIENHMDRGFYLMSEDIPEEELGEIETPCEMCGDHDSIIGQVSDWKQFKKLTTDDEGWCPYSDEYLQSVFEEDNQ